MARNGANGAAVPPLHTSFPLYAKQHTQIMCVFVRACAQEFKATFLCLKYPEVFNAIDRARFLDWDPIPKKSHSFAARLKQ